ncbi:hypothetical protein QTJ16_001729 [Diplocarpon rosae]|uniref:Signal peptidase complex subunit 1 n=1 Tax=Diplocarpon rosae TaxID=946125 RepID=A0AAD9T358_9HELO|nr:hypothetical protein QTJ16_001729 [Diplocarpon rosae]
MADQILEQVRDLAEGQIDFEGQRLAEWLTTALLATFGAVAFIVGFVKEDIKLALRIGLAGSALTLLMVVPPWGFFKRHPVKWLPVADKGTHSQGTIVDGMVVI